MPNSSPTKRRLQSKIYVSSWKNRLDGQSRKAQTGLRGRFIVINVAQNAARIEKDQESSIELLIRVKVKASSWSMGIAEDHFGIEYI